MTLDEVNDLVNEIQQLLISELEPAEEELMDLAGRHEEFVKAVSKRLSGVEKLLHKGLRSEAIELAEREPNLNDLVTALDFSEFDAWNELLARFEMQPVQALPADLAAELNDAYSASGSVDKLLQRFRTLSLARAPLHQRIDVLRRLAVHDADNVVWKQDLELFEKHRLSEVKRELDVAIQRSDVNHVATLDEELSSNDWHVAVSPAIVKQARDAHRKLRQSSARHDLEAVSHALSDAYADFDVRQARQLRQRFLALASVADLAKSDSLYDVVGPALDWLQEEDQRESHDSESRSARTALEVALDRRSTTEELEQLYHQATRHGQPLPKILEDRLADRLETLRVTASRKRKAIVATVTSTSLLLIAAVGLIIRQVGIKKAITTHSTQITALLQDAGTTGVIQPVADYLKRLETEQPDLAAAPELVGLKQQFEVLQTSEAGRLRQLRELVATTTDRGMKASRLDQFSDLFVRLKQADEMCRNPEERTLVVTAESEVRKRESELQSQVDTAFGADLKELTEEIAKLPSDSLTSYTPVLNRLGELESRTFVSPELQTSVKALHAKVTQQHALVSAALGMAQDMQGITDTVGQLEGFQNKLVDYSRRHPGSQRAKDFETLVNSEQHLWKGAVSWNAIRQRMISFDVATVTTSQAQTLLDEFIVFQKESGPYPGETMLDSRLAVLRAIANRKTGDDGTIIDHIKSLFAARTISEAHMVTTRETDKSNEETLYYTADAPRNSGKSLVIFSFFTTTSGTQSSEKKIAASRMPDFEQKTPETWLAPQSRMTRTIVEQLKTVPRADFEATVALVIQQILKANDVDPILRFLLLEKLLTIGSEGSAFFAARAQDQLKQMPDAGVSRLTNWVLPGDERAKKERSNAQFFLSNRSAEILQSIAMVTSDRIDFQKKQKIGAPVRWVGWLHRNTQGDWTVSFPPKLVRTGGERLWALRQPGASSAAVVVELGRLPAGTVTSLSVTLADPAMEEGRPVFLVLDGE